MPSDIHQPALRHQNDGPLTTTSHTKSATAHFHTAGMLLTSAALLPRQQALHDCYCLQRLPMHRPATAPPAGPARLLLPAAPANAPPLYSPASRPCTTAAPLLLTGSAASSSLGGALPRSLLTSASGRPRRRVRHITVLSRLMAEVGWLGGSGAGPVSSADSPYLW